MPSNASSHTTFGYRRSATDFQAAWMEDTPRLNRAVGQTVTFTVRLMGNAAAPTGTVVFKANGIVIDTCNAVAVSNSQATCTTTALAAGTYQITGTYSGDSTYGAGLAGPITQTVR